MEIRELCWEELQAASDILWKSFYEAEKHNTSMLGMERFRDLTSPVSLSMNTYDGSIVLYGGFSDGKMVAVGALKDENKIMMLYVHPSFWRKGYGTEMLAFLEDQIDSHEIHLNASDFGIRFYEHKGYRILRKRREEEGLIFTEMVKFLRVESNS